LVASIVPYNESRTLIQLIEGDYLDVGDRAPV
jgi:hypothetical protein